MTFDEMSDLFCRMEHLECVFFTMICYKSVIIYALYLKGLHYIMIKIHLSKKIAKWSFQNILNLLKDEAEFTQTHRSYIINMRYIREFASTSIKLQSGVEIPVSRNFSQSTKQDYFEFAKLFFN